jgi:hypothetical protein
MLSSMNSLLMRTIAHSRILIEQEALRVILVFTIGVESLGILVFTIGVETLGKRYYQSSLLRVKAWGERLRKRDAGPRTL